MSLTLSQFLGRLGKHTRLIVEGHVLNWPWRSRTERRKVRYRATQSTALRYLARYIPFIRDIEVAAVDSGDSGPERVFTIWLQGERNAPKIVKACIASMRRHLKQEVVVLDESTLFDWIELPQYITDKWKSGRMRAAHFCDVCRVELLWRHGGVWLDSTAFVTAPVPQWIMDEDYFMFMSGTKIRGSYSFVQNCFIRARRGNPLLGVWREAILNYWKHEDSVINYFTHQLLFRHCVENNATAARCFAAMPRHDQDPTHTVWDAHKDEPFSAEWFGVMTGDAFFQKTEYKTASARSPVPGSVADILSNMY